MMRATKRKMRATKRMRTKMKVTKRMRKTSFHRVECLDFGPGKQTA